MINVEVSKGPNESAVSVLKRFTRRVQGTGLLPRMRSIRYSERKPSKYVRKKKALKHLVKREHTAELIKLGKITPRIPGSKRS